MATYAVQSIRVPRDHAGVHSAATARTVARRYARRDAARVGKVDTTGGFYRFRLRAPGHFRPGTYRTYTSPSGVEIVSAIVKARRNPKATVCACEQVDVPRSNPSAPWTLEMGRNDRHQYRLPVRLRHGRATHRAYYNAMSGVVNGAPPMTARERRELHAAAKEAYRELYPHGRSRLHRRR